MREMPNMLTSEFFKGRAAADYLDFGLMPIANAFGPKNAQVNSFHMVADFFDDLKLVKLQEQPQNIEMFNENYAFFTGTSKGMIAHFEDTSRHLAQRLSWDTDSLIFEIGCNDGTFLNAARRFSKYVRGVEPSQNVADTARKTGIDVDVEFFGCKYSNLDRYAGRVNTIYAANVICHIPDILDVMAAAKILLKTGGFFVFEDPYLGSMLSKGSFDQIYDEHTYIFSLESVREFGAQSGLKLVDCEWLPTHGGSMRYYLQNTEATESSNVRIWQEYEEIFLTKTTFASFKETTAFGKKIMKRALENFVDQGLVVEGLGATSKSTTILNYYDLDYKHISSIYDNSPGKIGKFTPRTNIPIKSDVHFGEQQPDILFLFAWNHEKEVRKKYSSTLSATKIITHLKKDFEKLI